MQRLRVSPLRSDHRMRYLLPGHNVDNTRVIIRGHRSLPLADNDMGSHSIGSLNPTHHIYSQGHLPPDNLIRIFCNPWKVNIWKSPEYLSCDFMNTETCDMTETLHGCDDKALKALIWVSKQTILLFPGRHLAQPSIVTTDRDHI